MHCPYEGLPFETGKLSVPTAIWSLFGLHVITTPLGGLAFQEALLVNSLKISPAFFLVLDKLSASLN